MRTYAHLDADCFYVSAERVRYAFLRGKAVGILGNQGAIVIAKSYEMKKAGVKTGMPIWDAIRLCPDGVYIKRDFRWYEILSRQMLEVVRECFPRVEYYSIDEFFIEIPQTQDLQQMAEFLREHILHRVHVPITIGIGRTKTLAKLISDTAKPFGALALTNSAAEKELLASLPVTEISGIAGRRAARLEPVGIRTCLDLATMDRLLVRHLLTRCGEAIWYELNGDAVLPLFTERPLHKILSRGGSLGESTADPDRLLAWLTRNMERLVEELEFYVIRTASLSIYLNHTEGGGGFYQVDLPAPTDRFDLLMESARYCFQRAWQPGREVYRMHLIASQLRRPGFTQLGLFDPPEGPYRAVAEVKRRVNVEVGRFKLRSGSTLPLYDIYRDEAQSYDICDVHGKMCF